jgi:transcriptional regulator with XRE-family HTH domain
MQRLKELRAEKGLTQAELASVLSLNQTAVGKYERGQLEPTFETLMKLSRFFEVSIDYLIGNSDDFGNVIVAGSSPRDEMTADERTLLADFRTLPDGERAQALAYVEYLAEKRGAKTKKA